MEITLTTDDDWPAIYAFFRPIVEAGETYTYDAAWTAEEAKAVWLTPPPGQTVVARDGADVLGSAHMGPNRPGNGAHVATASFMVDPAHQGRGVGRALGSYVVDWARSAGFHGMQFNAVVETNAPAVALWQSLGFAIIGTVPETFNHPTHGLVGLHVMYQKLS
jgi:GNAT superfamily N-acetyltransferase